MNTNATEEIEIERKYIIKMPDISLLANQLEYTRSEITQIYITSAPGETHRIRRRVYPDRVQLFETRKIRIDNISVTEIESEISESEYDRLSRKMLEGTKPIEKTRHTFMYEGQIFEIDIYPQWKSTAIMETELSSREDRAQIPAFIEMIREVTGEKIYSNASMSSSFPPEII